MDDHHHQNLGKVSLMATLHCLTGCAVGEVLGMIIGSIFSLHNTSSIILSIVLAFLFGYSFSLIPLVRSMSLAKALPLALASDTVSITVMEAMDNFIIWLIPGALGASLTTGLFWGSLIVSLVVAFMAAYPVNYYLISRGKGHALIHHH